MAPLNRVDMMAKQPHEELETGRRVGDHIGYELGSHEHSQKNQTPSIGDPASLPKSN